MISAVRNTCFAILSAIESDLRETLGDLALSSGTIEILTPDIRKVAAQRFELDNKGRPGVVAENDLDLLEYTDFADLGKMVRQKGPEVTALSGRDASELANEIERMTAARNRVCHSRPLEEDDLAKFYDFAKFLITDYEGLGWRYLSATRKELDEDPSFVFRLAIPSFWRGAEGLHHNLPIPDFDETGFIGRTNEKRDLLKHILGPHPVISVVGEGGVGKSALVLWCLYEILEMKDHQNFDAIVWVSLKTKMLTPIGVEEIRDSIVGTLGIFQTAINVLGGPSHIVDADILLKEIRDYMDSLRILLVIDNLETVPVTGLRPFLSSIPNKSKVVITSRVGLGELELRYKLDPLDKKQSIYLMRRFSKSLNVRLIADASDDRLEKYCRFLYFNPLLIKWFISSVAAGADPDHLSAKGNQAFAAALQFCFENLFTRLSPEEQEILYILASARRQLTNAELYFLLQEVTALNQAQLEAALSVLHNSSMLKRSVPASRSADSGTLIALTDVAGDYISRFAPPPPKTFERVKNSLKKLRELTEKAVVQEAIYKYEIFAVRAESRDERITGMYLHSALELSKVGNATEARVMIGKAKTLLPTSAEAYRISALVESAAQDFYRAAEEIETAIELNSLSPLIHYQYAVFLLNEIEDSEHALAEIDIALSLDGADETLRTMRALALTRVGKYKDAAEIYESLLPHLSERPRRWRITTRDQTSECYRRWAEQDRTMLEFERRHQHLDRALAILEDGFGVKDFDKRTGALYSSIIEDGLFASMYERDQTYTLNLLSHFRDASFVVECPPFKRLTLEQFLYNFAEDQEFVTVVREFTDRYNVKWCPINSSETRVAVDRSEIIEGRIRSLPVGTKFGFIVDVSGGDWFFHQGYMKDPRAWINLQEGSRVRFKQGSNKTGKCAVDVVPLA